MKVVDWQKRAEKLTDLAYSWARFTYEPAAVWSILASTERDEPDAAPVPAFAAGQWVRHTGTNNPYHVQDCSGARVWFHGYNDYFDCRNFARIPDPPTSEWMRANAPGWRLTGRVEDCSRKSEGAHVSVIGISGDPSPYSVETCPCIASLFSGYRWTVERIPEHEAVSDELASIRARLDEIAAIVGA